MEMKIKIWNDSSAENPFEAWDCEPELMYYSGGRHGNTTDCSKGKIVSFIKSKATTGMLKRHLRTICFDIFEIDLSWCEDFEQKEDQIIGEIDNADLKELYKMCTVLKIPCSLHESRGYSQGDWAQVLIVCTDEFFERTGCLRKNTEEILKGSRELFDAWAWGDVFGFTIYDKKEFVKIPKDEYDKGNFENVEDLFEWEQSDSCGGFYGNNFEENGMLEYVPEQLKETVKNFDMSKVIYNY